MLAPSYFFRSLGMTLLLCSASVSNAQDKSFQECEDCPEMVVITTGSFAIGKYEVTQKQWHAVMGQNPSVFRGQARPVENVSWQDIQLYLDRLNKRLSLDKVGAYRLLTGAEWEVAARAGVESRWHCGEDESCLKDVAWYAPNSGQKTHAVGLKTPNDWGLYDVHGNVSEWVSDCWEMSEGTCTARTIRGGSWLLLSGDLSFEAPQWLEPEGRYGYVGFRVAKSL